MAKKTIEIKAGDSDFTIEKSNTSYHLGAKEIMSFTGIATNPLGDIDNILLTIDGTMTGAITALEIGAANSNGNKVVIGKSGLIDARVEAIVAIGDNTVITNLGTVFAADDMNSVGIASNGDGALIKNAGFLKAATGFEVTGGGNKIINSGVLGSFPGTIGAEFFSQTDEVNRFVNTGALHGSVGVMGGDGNEIIINKGKMSGGLELGAGDDRLITTRYVGGDVEMGDGADRVVLKGKGNFVSLDAGSGDDLINLTIGDALGTSTTISGGMDDDTYIVSRADLVLDENAGQGTDTVKSSVTFALAAEFENLVLIGTKAIDGSGNAAANVITGNGEKNVILGLAGTDILDGGRGNDTLSGGTQADTFVFRAHSGKDLITDFTDMSDMIDLSGYKGIDDFGDLSGKISQKGADTVITLLDGDRITLTNFTAANLTIADFQF